MERQKQKQNEKCLDERQFYEKNERHNAIIQDLKLRDREFYYFKVC